MAFAENWQEQYERWQNLKKNCIAARGPNGIYCELRGVNCSFLGCVLRLFDSQSDITKMRDLEDRIAELEKKNETLQTLIKDELGLREKELDTPSEEQPKIS